MGWCQAKPVLDQMIMGNDFGLYIGSKVFADFFYYPQAKELHHKKAITLLFGVRRSRLGPIQIQAVLKRPEWRASAKLAESPVMIIKSVFLI